MTVQCAGCKSFVCRGGSSSRNHLSNRFVLHRLVVRNELDQVALRISEEQRPPVGPGELRQPDLYPKRLQPLALARKARQIDLECQVIQR